ncbi:hypothetical protein B0T18DRAFT_436927 [Schizothecium vesticola]|uniref:D-arabinono-1,4-lactone oxidase n=1 Tax=Schizothecium vesticola TaxID=314040 RepID=A0AA40F171_9PEZI|nr:hypothetical protein B0T18DRAFT_436927 [Schizothecium vesticola]
MTSLLLPLLLPLLTTAALTLNTFDGPGFPSCLAPISAIHTPPSIPALQSLIRTAALAGHRVRAAGAGHSWYDTQCSSSTTTPTVILRTDALTAITDLSLPGAKGEGAGSVVVEAGVTFFQLAAHLHERGASVGYALTNWNITFGGAVAMGAHRSSLREASMVADGAEGVEIVDASGGRRWVERGDGSGEEWAAASTSLGLLGVIVRVRLRVWEDAKVFAMQKTLEEKEVLDGDIYGMIAPYATANLWWWPYKRKFHHRYYDVVPTNSTPQEGFQNTFSVTELEAIAARTLLDSGKYLATSNMLAEEIFFGLWSKPNFRDKRTNEHLEAWPVYGWNYDVLIGGLYPDQKPEWEYGLHGLTLELAFPVTMANRMLKRVRALFDEELRKGIVMTSTYRSGINIKFGKAYFDLLGQGTYNTSDGADWSKGTIMFDFPTFRPNVGDNKRFNEDFYHNLANALIDEFPCRPHWTKNSREVLARSVKNLDPNHLRRFNEVRKRFDPDGMFRSAVGEILGFYD